MVTGGQALVVVGGVVVGGGVVGGGVGQAGAGGVVLSSQ